MWESFTTNFVNLVRFPPGSMLFILVVSTFVALVSTGLNKVLVDHDEMNRKKALVDEHNKKKKYLQELSESDPKKYAKEYKMWKRRDASMQKIQQSTAMTQLKPTCATFLPMILFFYALRNFYTIGENYIPIAAPPMNPSDLIYVGQMMHASIESSIRNINPEEGWINFTGFYFLCSFSMNTFIQKIFGVQRPQPAGGGMGSMFDQKIDLPAPKF